MSEESILIFELARNEAEDKYFNARQGLDRTTHAEMLFRSGFRMAYEQYQATDKEALIQEIEKLSTVALRYASDYEDGVADGKNETIDDVLNIIRGDV